MSAGSVTWQQGAVSAAAGQPTATAIAQVVDGINRFTFSDLETREAAALLTGPGAQRQALSCDLLGLYTAEAVDEVLQIVSANGELLGSCMLPDEIVVVTSQVSYLLAERNFAASCCFKSRTFAAIRSDIS